MPGRSRYHRARTRHLQPLRSGPSRVREYALFWAIVATRPSGSVLRSYQPEVWRVQWTDLPGTSVSYVRSKGVTW